MTSFWRQAATATHALIYYKWRGTILCKVVQWTNNIDEQQTKNVVDFRHHSLNSTVHDMLFVVNVRISSWSLFVVCWSHSLTIAHLFYIVLFYVCSVAWNHFQLCCWRARELKSVRTRTDRKIHAIKKSEHRLHMYVVVLQYAYTKILTLNVKHMHSVLSSE